jgi:hypothetical protein
VIGSTKEYGRLNAPDPMRNNLFLFYYYENINILTTVYSLQPNSLQKYNYFHPFSGGTFAYGWLT